MKKFSIFAAFFIMMFASIGFTETLNDTNHINGFEIGMSSGDALSAGTAWKTVVGADSVYLQTKYSAPGGWVYFYYYSALTRNNGAYRDSNVVTIYARIKNHQDSLLYTVTVDTLKKSGGNFVLPFNIKEVGFYYDVYAKVTHVAAADTTKFNKFGVGKRKLK